MKRFIALAIVVMLTLMSLAGCADTSNSNQTTSPDITATPARAKIALVLGTGGKGDNGSNDEAIKGAKRAETSLSVKVDIFEPKTSSDYDAMISSIAKGGTYDLIIVASMEGEKAVKKYAAKYPNQKFSITDVTIAGLSNVKSIQKNYAEMAFLSGVLAGLVTKEESMSLTTKGSNIIGIEIAVDNAATRAAQAGFTAGAKLVNPTVEVKVSVVGSWNDIVRGKELASSMYASGADVIMCFAGNSSNGVIEAAVEKGKYAIGVSANQNGQAPENVIASCTEVIGLRVYSEVEQLLAGIWQGGVDSGGLREGAVDIVYDESKVSLSKEIKEKIADLKHQVVVEYITIPTDPTKVDAWLLTIQK